MSRDAYRDAGVDIDAGEALVERIKPHARSTQRPGVIGGLGGFGGLFSLMGRFEDPILVSGTDGVGTKLLVAQKLGKHGTIGIDLVAMCVNDIVITGAEPLFFLDYFATGKLDNDDAEQVVAGIAEGCRQAGCALLGGETAEMPGMYAPGHYDLAGFAVGAVERSKLLDGSAVAAGDVLVALPSTGIHSNGYSLARKLLVDSGKFALDEDPGGLGGPLGDVLLTPTRIYVKDVLTAIAEHELKAAAHITGGGLPGNVPRVLPEGLGARIVRGSWPELPIFTLLRDEGDLSENEMLRTFNCGVGMVLVFAADRAQAAAEALGGVIIGEIVDGDGVEMVEGDAR
ncbi:MAG: phosphoribosylformylglycinamidine cyclo-ligase [Deltaproteobacteria bacterium]|nr:MAG: phosphoribosylformylglycinamidine cyclo-ligase [Deltaproteobacteria bacterium]